MPGDCEPDPELETRTAHVPPPTGPVHPEGAAPTVEPAPADPNATRVKPGGPPSAVGAAALTIPGYDLMPKIAEGGMGMVFAARDLALDREVAVKVMKPGMDAVAFVREARITGRLPHPGIPPVQNLGTLPDGRPFLAMKLIKGDTLDTVLKTRPDRTATRAKLLAAFE
jgi:eukaryotic-like serine/threonine-protein kinase